MILADTNVLSELMRPRQDARVLDWVDRHTSDIGIPAQVLSELAHGIERLIHPDRKVALRNGLALLMLRFGDRVVPFDRQAAETYAWLKTKCEAEGREDKIIDNQIAAIGIARDATVATRNVRDFKPTGVRVIDPWEA